MIGHTLSVDMAARHPLDSIAVSLKMVGTRPEDRRGRPKLDLPGSTSGPRPTLPIHRMRVIRPIDRSAHGRQP